MRKATFKNRTDAEDTLEWLQELIECTGKATVCDLQASANEHIGSGFQNIGWTNIDGATIREVVTTTYELVLPNPKVLKGE